jgi:hypothetical protein
MMNDDNERIRHRIFEFGMEYTTSKAGGEETIYDELAPVHTFSSYKRDGGELVQEFVRSRDRGCDW